MYFNILPSIKYDLKPIGYPFSESDFVVAKNFFKRFKITDSAFNQTIFYQKFAVTDGDRLEQIAEKLYGSPFYDWIIVLTNNMTDPLFSLPMTENELRKHVEKLYSNPYYDIHHYEIISDEKQEELFGKVIMSGGTWVDEQFYNNREQYTAGSLPNLTPDTLTLPVFVEYIFTDPSEINTLDNNLIVENTGTSFVPYGNGQGSDGGFVLYPASKGNLKSKGYLRFRGGGFNPRTAQLNALDATLYNKITLYGKFGTNFNGGELPDVVTNEYLTVQYRTNPLELWTDMGVIIDIGVCQGIAFGEDRQPPSEYGGTGRPEGVYENVTVYDFGGNPTSMRVTVTVNNDYEVSDVQIVDRGNQLIDSQTYYIRNDDLGAGYILNPVGSQVPLNDYEIDVYTTSSNGLPTGGYQIGRYDTEPYQFSLDIPPAARTPTTEFRLYQPNNTGDQNDQYAVSAIYFSGSQTTELPLDFEWNQIDADHYVIDGNDWVRVDGIWYLKTEQGYQYWDGTTVSEISGNVLARPVTQFEYEQTENEKKREIYILKPQFLDAFVADFKKASLYKKSSDFVSNRLKKTGI